MADKNVYARSVEALKSAPMANESHTVLIVEALAYVPMEDKKIIARIKNVKHSTAIGSQGPNPALSLSQTLKLPTLSSSQHQTLKQSSCQRQTLKLSSLSSRYGSAAEAAESRWTRRASPCSVRIASRHPWATLRTGKSQPISGKIWPLMTHNSL